MTLRRFPGENGFSFVNHIFKHIADRFADIFFFHAACCRYDLIAVRDAYAVSARLCK